MLKVCFFFPIAKGAILSFEDIESNDYHNHISRDFASTGQRREAQDKMATQIAILPFHPVTILTIANLYKLLIVTSRYHIPFRHKLFWIYKKKSVKLGQ